MYSGLKVLEELKKAGITHRDVRPENLTISKDFEVCARRADAAADADANQRSRARQVTFNNFVMRTGKHFHGSKQYLSGDYIRVAICLSFFRSFVLCALWARKVASSDRRSSTKKKANDRCSSPTTSGRLAVRSLNSSTDIP